MAHLQLMQSNSYFAVVVRSTYRLNEELPPAAAQLQLQRSFKENPLEFCRLASQLLLTDVDPKFRLAIALQLSRRVFQALRLSRLSDEQRWALFSQTVSLLDREQDHKVLQKLGSAVQYLLERERLYNFRQLLVGKCLDGTPRQSVFYVLFKALLASSRNQEEQVSVVRQLAGSLLARLESDLRQSLEGAAVYLQRGVELFNQVIAKLMELDSDLLLYIRKWGGLILFPVAIGRPFSPADNKLSLGMLRTVGLLPDQLAVTALPLALSKLEQITALPTFRELLCEDDSTQQLVIQLLQQLLQALELKDRPFVDGLFWQLLRLALQLMVAGPSQYAMLQDRHDVSALVSNSLFVSKRFSPAAKAVQLAALAINKCDNLQLVLRESMNLLEYCADPRALPQNLDVGMFIHFSRQTLAESVLFLLSSLSSKIALKLEYEFVLHTLLEKHWTYLVAGAGPMVRLNAACLLVCLPSYELLATLAQSVFAVEDSQDYWLGLSCFEYLFKQVVFSEEESFAALANQLLRQVRPSQQLYFLVLARVRRDLDPATLLRVMAAVRDEMERQVDHVASQPKSLFKLTPILDFICGLGSSESEVALQLSCFEVCVSRRVQGLADHLLKLFAALKGRVPAQLLKQLVLGLLQCDSRTSLWEVVWSLFLHGEGLSLDEQLLLMLQQRVESSFAGDDPVEILLASQLAIWLAVKKKLFFSRLWKPTELTRTRFLCLSGVYMLEGAAPIEPQFFLLLDSAQFSSQYEFKVICLVLIGLLEQGLLPEELRVAALQNLARVLSSETETEGKYAVHLSSEGRVVSYQLPAVQKCPLAADEFDAFRRLVRSEEGRNLLARSGAQTEERAMKAASRRRVGSQIRVVHHIRK